MPEKKHPYIWRCVNCGNHFANIKNADGSIIQEKKCPKCKALNKLTHQKNEIHLSCLVQGHKSAVEHTVKQQAL